MKIQSLKITGLFAALAILASCATTGQAAGAAAGANANGAPRWMSDLEADYPDARFLAAVGSGSNRRNAEDDASGALAGRFNVNIKRDSVAEQRYAEIVKGDSTYTELEKAVSQTVQTQANEQFINLRFSDPYTDDRGQTHVVAYIERDSTAALYRTTIQKDLAKADGFMDRASAMTGALQRYAFYDAAYSVGLNAERMIGQLQIIHPNTARMLDSQLDLRKAVAARDAEAGKLTYTISLSGDTDKRLEGIIRKVLETQALSYQERGLLAVKGSWKTEPIALNPQFKSVLWTADISLFDESGAAIATYSKQNRSHALYEAQAVSTAFREAEKELNKAFIASIQNYLTRIVTGE